MQSCKYSSWIKSVHHSLPHLQPAPTESSPFFPPSPCCLALFLVEARSLCSRALEQSDGSHSTVLTHKGSCTCFDLHFSNASGGISISEMHFFCKVSMFFFSSTKLKKKKRRKIMQFFFILKLSCDLYLSSPEACEKNLSYVLKIIQKIE